MHKHNSTLNNMIEQVYSHAKYQIILFRYVLDKYRKKLDIYRKYPIFSIFLKKSWFFPSLPATRFRPPSATVEWSLLNRFRTEQGHCGACRRKWRLTDTDLCPCGETHTMFHVVESCPLTKLNGGLSRLCSADEDAVSWLTSYGSWHKWFMRRFDEQTPPASQCQRHLRGWFR